MMQSGRSPKYAVQSFFGIPECVGREIYVVSVSYSKMSLIFPANIYLFKGNSRNSRKRFEICSKLTIKTPERRN